MSICCGASAACLYGEGYTIRGVQRILKEHGIKAVQGVADQSAAVSFGAVEEAIGKSLNEPDEAETLTVESDDDDFDGEEQGIDYRFVEADEEGILASFGKRRTAPRAQAAAASTRGLSAADRERLERVLLDLVACRQSLDAALKDG